MIPKELRTRVDEWAVTAKSPNKLMRADIARADRWERKKKHPARENHGKPGVSFIGNGALPEYSSSPST